MQNNPDHFIWAEYYRPHRVADCILPQSLKDTFQAFVDNKNVPTLMLAGGPGMGKTTVAQAICDELNVNCLVIPCSMSRGIDTLRNEIQSFASSVSFKGTRKYVILDEVDNITVDFQKALRNFMDLYASNCGFILTCNYKSKIIEPLHSRCSIIDFNIAKEDAPKLAAQFHKRIIEILNAEGIKQYDLKSIAAVINKFYPDWRRIINEIQRYAASGSIDSGILTNLTSHSIKQLIGFMKEKNFTTVRHWAASASSDFTQLYRDFYDEANEYFKPSYIPELVLLIAKYMSQSGMVFDQEINFVAFCVEVMVGAEWK